MAKRCDNCKPDLCLFAGGGSGGGGGGGGGSGDSAFQTLDTVSDTKTGQPGAHGDYQLTFSTQISYEDWESPCAVRNCIISVDGVSTNVPVIQPGNLVEVNAPDYLSACSVEPSVDDDAHYCVIFKGTLNTQSSQEITVSISFELYSYSDEYLALTY